jgi:hypothetical protein
VNLPRAATSTLSGNLLDFVLGIPIGLLALAAAWRLFRPGFISALEGRGGWAALHAAFLILIVPAIAMGVWWLPLVKWSLVGGYALGAGGGFFVLLHAWMSRLPDQ